MLQLVNSTVKDVSHKEDVGYDAVDGVIERCIHASVNWDEFTELKIIGIDEIAMTKGRRNFVAIITTQQADGHVALLGVLADRTKETVRQFFWRPFPNVYGERRKRLAQTCGMAISMR